MAQEKGEDNMDTPNYREAFISFLNNRDKSRKGGFVVFVHGAVDLKPIEDACFPPQQSFNHCLTARYGATYGETPIPLISKFLVDIASNIQDPTTKQNQSSSMPGKPEVIGNFRPLPPEGKWPRVMENLKGIRTDRVAIYDFFFSYLESVLETGDRLILLCELSNVPEDATLADIGFTDEFLKHLESKQPKRFGLVFSGLPRSLAISQLGNRFLGLEVGADYENPGLPPERSQKLENDSPSGEDRLQIAVEVHAIADAIASTDMVPPLVVGVLGGWGSGKSFVLHLLRERLRHIRKQDISNESARKAYPYVGHPYIVQFDAWTYAKSDLWASLMQRILFDLDKQLTLEQNLKSAKVDLLKGVDLWSIIENFSEKQLEALGKELGQEALQSIKNWKEGKETASSLWKTLEKLHSDELDKLKTARDNLKTSREAYEVNLRKNLIDSENKLLKEQQQLEKSLSDLQQSHRNELSLKQAEIETENARITDEVNEEIETAARIEAWTPLRQAMEGFFGEAANKVFAKTIFSGGESPATIWAVANELNIFIKFIKGFSFGSLIFLLAAILSATILPWLLTQIRLPDAIASVIGTTGTLGGFLATAYSALSKTNRWLEEKQSAYEANYQTTLIALNDRRNKRLAEEKEKRILKRELDFQSIQIAQKESMSALEKENQESLKNLRLGEQGAIEKYKQGEEEKLRSLEKEVEEHVRRAGIPGQSKSLQELIKNRIESGYYEERLGIIHQVQKDLQEITDALLPIDGLDTTIFPRGEPRIILIIDDLDRCPPKQVVQVLEAAQLLVKTKLFVVILAMDVRYVTRALEKEYEGILVHDGNPSGLDYIEKIVQISYYVHPITSKKAMNSYLQAQLKIRLEDQDVVNVNPPGEYTTKPQAIIVPPGQSLERVNAALPPEIQQFSPEEFELLETCTIGVEITPRSTKRLVNAMKLIKIIWYRSGIEEPAIEIKKVIALLLSLSAKYPEIMVRVLDELEKHFRHPRSSFNDQTFKSAMEQVISEWSKREGIADDWIGLTGLINDSKLLNSEVILDTIGMSNIQIVRSFSFLGETDAKPVQEVQQHNVTLLDPVDKSTNKKQAKNISRTQ